MRKKLKVGKFFFEFICRRCLESLLVVLVKVTRVAILTLGYEGRLDFFLIDGYPIGGGEPLVALDVVDAVLQVAKALCQIDLE